MKPDPLLPWILCVGMLSVRLTMALALSPAISAFGVPAPVRVALVIALAGLTFAYREPVAAAAAWSADPGRMLGPVFAEAFTGALLGLTVQIVLGALALAGRLLDVQIGFAIGSVFDPVTGAASNVLGSITGLLGVTLFVVGDAHLQLAQLISQSLDVLPLGQWPPLNQPLELLLAAGSLFSLGLALAAPIVAALLLTDLAIGVASRNMPQMNVLMLALPIKILVGYGVVILAMKGWGPLVGAGFNRVSALFGAH